MARFYAPPASWNGDQIALDAAESRHASEVLRLKSGDALVVFDGQGRRASGVLLNAGRHGATVRVESVSLTPRPVCEITLVQAVPKGKLMDWILEKATELGVARIVPVITERTVVHIDAADAQKKREKWSRTVVEACKQCGQDWLPEVDLPQSLGSFLKQKGTGDLAVFGSLYPGAKSFSEVLASVSRPQGSAVFIGPEGDFTAGEVQLMLDWGAKPVTLGPIILRVETAAMYCLSVLSHSFASLA
ncbi:MAG: 16S rRNA (uracil(1498)-N(3))-methyltransferase [Verrucomicrobiota bacterium]